MKKKYTLIPVLALSLAFVACDDKKTASDNDKNPPPAEGEGEKPAAKDGEEEHDHDEVSLGTFQAGDLEIEAAQGHGLVEAGKESHLVIKLPYKDDGATVVRAWIGTDDRTLGTVGKGEYAPSHDDYEIHAVAPSPLPDGVMWWVEVEKPDGTKSVGSIKPKL